MKPGIYLLVIGFMCCFTWSCDEEEVLPIEEEKMALILADIHIAEAALQNVYASKKDSLSAVYYQQVYDIHKIDRPELDSAMAVLYRNPNLQLDVYNRVMEILQEYEVKFEH
ncbi:MAG: DUF4296 domain-containing protein [Bacteroidota bacterium]